MATSRGQITNDQWLVSNRPEWGDNQKGCFTAEKFLDDVPSFSVFSPNLSCVFFLFFFLKKNKIDLTIQTFFFPNDIMTSILIGFSMKNHPSWGSPMTMETRLRLGWVSPRFSGQAMSASYVACAVLTIFLVILTWPSRSQSDGISMGVPWDLLTIPKWMASLMRVFRTISV